MSSDTPLQAAKEGISLVGEVIKAARGDPLVREAASNLGQTAVTITKTINNALLPLAAVNFAFDKARAYFSEKFEQDLGEKASRIPPESIIEPKASIAGPTLQGLAFTHEEQSLKDMYLNLLATAMDGRAATNAHPAFVEIIKQLDAEDANMLRGALQSPSPIAIAQARLTTVGTPGYQIIATHLLNLCDEGNQTPIENERLPVMVDNWTRLGLIEVDYVQHLTDEAAYEWVEKRPEFVRLRAQFDNELTKVTFQKGFLVRTKLGERFASVVGLLA